MTVLERLKELEAKATKGPWVEHGETWEGDSTAGYGLTLPDKGCVFVSRWTDRGTPDKLLPIDEADGRLIAAMRNALPHLITVAEAVKFAVEENYDILLPSHAHMAALAELTKGAGDER